MGPNHLSCIPSGETRGSLDEALPDVELFKINTIMYKFFEIVTYLMIGHAPYD